MRHSDHFRKFAEELRSVIASKATDQSQKDQVEGLVRKETRFRRSLTNHPEGRAVFREFIRHIVEERKNILSARPYFRERQEVFSAKIAPALKARAPSRLYNFKVNYLFVVFALSRYKGRRAKAVAKLAEDVRLHREGVVERNLPLAINRAKLFWSKVPHSSTMEYMDLVQTATEGLISAVDKFVPPYTTVFRSVAIGRMAGNMVETYSDTTIHFYPSDKRELYRANITSHRKNLTDLGKVVEEMNRQRKETWVEMLKETPALPEPKYVTKEDMHHLMRAASPLSMDSKLGGEDTQQTMYSRIADPGPSPEDEVVGRESYGRLHSAMSCLTPFEKKVLLLKGVTMGGEKSG